MTTASILVRSSIASLGTGHRLCERRRGLITVQMQNVASKDVLWDIQDGEGSEQKRRWQRG